MGINWSWLDGILEFFHFATSVALLVCRILHWFLSR
jgi:hypothetical protein